MKPSCPFERVFVLGGILGDHGSGIEDMWGSRFGMDTVFKPFCVLKANALLLVSGQVLKRTLIPSKITLNRVEIIRNHPKSLKLPGKGFPANRKGVKVEKACCYDHKRMSKRGHK